MSEAEEKNAVPEETTQEVQMQDEQTQEEQTVIEQKKEINKDNVFLRKVGIMIFTTFAVCVLFFFVLLRYKGFASVFGKFMKVAEPIIFGLILAYLLNPILVFTENCAKRLLGKRMKKQKSLEKTSRAVGIVFTVLFLLLMLGLLIAAIAPTLVTSIMTLADTMPEMVKKFLDSLDKGVLGRFQFTEIFSQILTKVTVYLEKWAQDTLLPQAQTYLAQITTGVISVVKAFVNFIIGIIVMVYVFMIKEKLVGQGKKIIYAFFPTQTGNVIIKTIRKTNEIFSGFISGKIIDSLIIGMLCYIGCVLLGIPNSMLIAVIIGATNVIPVFGPFVGAVPAILLTVIQSPLHALYLAIFILFLQQLDGNIIGPKILGDSTGLSSFWVMFAILIGGGLFGFLGMLVGVPTFAVFYYLVREVVDHCLKTKGLSRNTEEYLKVGSIDTATNTFVEKEEKQKKQK